MKKLKNTFVTGMTLLFAVVACQKDQQGPVSPQASNRVDVKRIDAVRGLAEFERKDAYLKLNADEKEYVWDQQLAGMYNRAGITAQQKEFLLRFMDATTPALFSDGAQSAAAMQTFEGYWTKESLRFFTRDELISTVSQVQGNGSKENKRSARVADGPCGCNSGSIWSCDTCQKGGCKTTSSAGCGFFMAFECNGGCGIRPEQT